MKKNIFFIGAGGIGMAALERYFLSQGHNVGGYDLTPTALTDALIKEGADINFDGSVESIPTQFRDSSDTLVVFTPAVPESLPCFTWFRKNGFEIVKRARLLGMITRRSKSLCFAGTHGKTTTSSIAAHILASTPMVGCNAFLGGILRNYHSNFILSADAEFTVIEADEFDRSFHQLSPYIAVVTAVDPDHLDIYGNEEEYAKSFEQFTSLIEPGGKLLMHSNLNFNPRVNDEVEVYTYSGKPENEAPDFHASNIRRVDSHLVFDLSFPDGTEIKDIEFGSPALINVDNAVAAIGAVWLAKALEIPSMMKALKSFKGVERRFEVRWTEESPGKRIIIDDYAHHPAEIEASIKSVKSIFPDRKITVVFQPHLYTRTRDFKREFAQALSNADEVVLTTLYPAREKPIPGISSLTILDLVENKEKQIIEKENFPDFVKNCNFEVLLTLGAGDLPNYIDEAVKLLEADNY